MEGTNREIFELGPNHTLEIDYILSTGAIIKARDEVYYYDENYLEITECEFEYDDELNIKRIESKLFQTPNENDQTGLVKYFSSSDAKLPFDTKFYLNGHVMYDKRSLHNDMSYYEISDHIRDMLSMNIKDIRRIMYKRHSKSLILN